MVERVKAPYTMGVPSNAFAYSWICADFVLIDQIVSEMVEEWLERQPGIWLSMVHLEPEYPARCIASSVPSRLWRTIDPEVFRMACYGEWLRRQG